ncbi:MAG: molybdate ABC transporter permease subunit, partial [Paracoccaceae bacterium]
SNIEGQTQTLPSAIYNFLQVPGGDQAALTLVGIAVLISVLALAASEILGARVRARVGGR